MYPFDEAYCLEQFQNLLAIANLKAMAHRVYLTEITQKGDEVLLTFYEKAQIDVSRMEAFLAPFNGRMSFLVTPQPMLRYARPHRGGKDKGDILSLIREILDKMQMLVLEK